MKKILNLKRRRNYSGFTLVEILLVIALLAMVMGAFVGGLGQIQKDAGASLADTFVRGSAKAPIMAYQLKNGKYPSSMQDLAPYFEGKAVPKDPWGNEYQFKYPGSKNSDGYDLWSMGPDLQNNTGDDIGNW